MNNPRKEKAENKLKLFDNPYFNQFVSDLSKYMDNPELVRFADVLRRMYIAEVKEIEDKENIFKQGNLGL